MFSYLGLVSTVAFEWVISELVSYSAKTYHSYYATMGTFKCRFWL
jgi:hypothetical protein